MEKAIEKLDEMMDGAIGERFRMALTEVWRNVYDLNTDPEKVRAITLKLTIKPTKNRDAAISKCDIQTKLASPMPLSKTVFIEQRDDGTVIATERTDQVAGQIDMEGEEVTPNVIQFQNPKNRAEAQ